MKRSEINRLIEHAIGFMDERGFKLPPFAFWTPEDWRRMGPEADGIRLGRLGWDITDFGGGDFYRMGLLLFTLRNGNARISNVTTKPYAEKIMLVEPGQVTPFHFHWVKMEDIINRGGGNLIVELYGSSASDDFTDEPIVVHCDGVARTVPPGGKVVLAPGESITLPPRLYHQFYGERGTEPVLVGEVSSVNDDATDNRFKEARGRFPAIEEDEYSRHILCNEYPSV
jgi:D-lyxose ketol-isomerase